MMVAVYPDLPFAVDFLEASGRSHEYRMAMSSIVRVEVRKSAGHVLGKVRVDRAAEHHVHELHAYADAEGRQLAIDRHLDETPVRLFSAGKHLLDRRMGTLAELERVEIESAGHEQTVDSVDVFLDDFLAFHRGNDDRDAASGVNTIDITTIENRLGLLIFFADNEIRTDANERLHAGGSFRGCIAQALEKPHPCGGPSKETMSPFDRKNRIEGFLRSQEKSGVLMRRDSFKFLKTLLLAVFVFLLSASFSSLQAQSADQVNRAIENGIAFLKSRQAANGSWPEEPTYPGGMTALVTLSLLSCDVPPESPVIQRALDYLRRIDPSDTYVVSLMAMAFAEAQPKQEFPRIQRYGRWLIDSQLPNGRWTYGPAAKRLGDGDNSNSQFAMLGLQAADQAGVPIPEKFWQQTRQHWIADQSNVGSWGYVSESTGTGSMTCAGIASLIIANRAINDVHAGTFGGRKVRCAGLKEDRNVQAGIDWLGRNFTVRSNPGGNNEWYYYYLYAMERAGRLSGRRFFGDHDWYRAGARILTAPSPFTQQPDGSWSLGGNQGIGQIYNTCFSLLFLSKGRIPIVVNKLRHAPGEDWNNSPSDVHNLTQFLAKQWHVKLNWQIVDARVASVEDLLQAPVLQFSGHDFPKFSPREKQSLRQYVSDGGMIMADANCSCGSFDKGFRDLCKELFPEAGQELRRLEPEHGVWNSLFKLPPDWPLFGIDIGCRTAIFYSPDDLSCQWEFADEPESLMALRIGSNIIAYGVGPEDLQDKLEERKTIDTLVEDQVKRNYLQIAKLRHNGDWNPAPLGIRNLMLSLREIAKIDVVAQDRVIDILDPNLTNYPLAYMTGRTRFQLDREQRERLAEFLSNGGVLFADACCGNERFDESFRAMIRELFPERNLEPIPIEHELFTDKIGYDIKTVKYGPALEGREGPPILEGVAIDGRYAVIYSKYDLGCALQRQQSRDCKGYSHESAIKIASNIVLYALKQ